jgi:hypothetical protein
MPHKEEIERLDGELRALRRKERIAEMRGKLESLEKQSAEHNAKAGVPRATDEMSDRDYEKAKRIALDAAENPFSVQIRDLNRELAQLDRDERTERNTAGKADILNMNDVEYEKHRRKAIEA